jgi:hypothetical protein
MEPLSTAVTPLQARLSQSGRQLRLENAEESKTYDLVPVAGIVSQHIDTGKWCSVLSMRLSLQSYRWMPVQNVKQSRNILFMQSLPDRRWPFIGQRCIEDGSRSCHSSKSTFH